MRTSRITKSGQRDVGEVEPDFDHRPGRPAPAIGGLDGDAPRQVLDPLAWVVHRFEGDRDEFLVGGALGRSLAQRLPPRGLGYQAAAPVVDRLADDELDRTNDPEAGLGHDEERRREGRIAARSVGLRLLDAGLIVEIRVRRRNCFCSTPRSR